ncbi:MAG: GNAT family N-acetyltransferase [Burkholderiales bacterium]|nr:GNAT family N-acetyltransferase [Burkholderiales bacterium]
MHKPSGTDLLEPRLITAQHAALLVRPGNRVFVGTGCATPRTLVAAIEALPMPIPDVEFVHFITTGAIPHDEAGRATTRYRHRSFFIGSDVRAAVRQGLAEYVPLPISRVPQLFANRRIPVDVALVQVSMPDEFGYVSLGVSVDVVAAAIENARLVIAEINPAMPWTMGESTVHLSRIHHAVRVDVPVTEYVHLPAGEHVVQQIARYIASIIEDGSTLQIGLGRIPNEALAHLQDRKDLGIHSDVVTDAIIPLLEKGILNGRAKSQHRGKIVTSFALGTRRLYDIVDRNPLFSFQPIETVCHPVTIASQHKMVSVTQAFAVDLAGQVCNDQFDGEFYSGLGAQGDFLRGASRSPGGKPIICLASTTDDGGTSRIRPRLLEGEAAGVPRTDVHYVITEYGAAYLFGKSIRERALALIELAHPRYRPWLLEEAKRLGYVAADQTLQTMRSYPVEEERWLALKDGRTVLLRPARASDAPAIRQLFFKLPPGDIYTRFFRRVKSLTQNEVERLCNYDYEDEVGFVAVTGPRENEAIVGQACYFVNPPTNLAETAFLIDPAWQGSGLGSGLQERLAQHARQRGVRGFVAEILPQNARMIALARRGSERVQVHRDADSVHVTTFF